MATEYNNGGYDRIVLKGTLADTVADQIRENSKTKYGLGEINIEVLKCLIKAMKRFTNEVGGFIILSFFICSIISTVLFYLLEYIKMKSYIHNLYEKFKLIILENITNNINSPPPKKDNKDEEDNKDSKDDNDSNKNKLSINSK